VTDEPYRVPENESLSHVDGTPIRSLVRKVLFVLATVVSIALAVFLGFLGYLSWHHVTFHGGGAKITNPAPALTVMFSFFAIPCLIALPFLLWNYQQVIDFCTESDGSDDDADGSEPAN
jgi:TRAP-type C4-dicarboxylate transport system permease small subunit